jgi:hypothetical protein
LKNIARIASLCLWLCSAGPAFSQGGVSQLPAELKAARVKLASAVGTGASSGSAIEGTLINQTPSTIRVDVNIGSALYLVNRGVGQNMIAVQVYLDGGAYEREGTRSYISLRPRARSRVVFVAYCADFAKENPSASEAFTTGQLPSSLVAVSDAIAKYSKANPDIDATVAAQVAVWLAQGVSPAQIRQKFPFTPADERMARTFLR